MPSKYDEIEYKYAADHVTIQRFNEWAMKLDPVRFKTAQSPDVYYTQGDHVLRHRKSDHIPGGELTVKLRKAKRSVADRREIDLRFAHDIGHDDVEEFLAATGWKRALTLQKSAAIFWYDHPQDVNMAIYDVHEVTPNGAKKRQMRFIEVEVEKGTDTTIEEARDILNRWADLLEVSFNLGTERQDLSLWEIYSGKRYKNA